MAKTRMLAWMRDKLLSNVTENVRPKVEGKALDEAYKRAAPLVLKVVEKKFPPKDMAVCKKYDATRVDDCIRVQFPSGVVQEFEFKRGSGPEVVSRSCNSSMYLLDDVAAKAVENWLTATEKFKEESSRRVTAYRALINSATNLDDVVEVWPEALKIIPPKQALIPFNPEQIAIIKTDLKERIAA